MVTWVGDGNGECRMCGEVARERWHVVTECRVVRELWDRLGPVLERISRGAVVKGEMAFGPLGESAAEVLRRRLGFSLRSAVHTMRGVEMGGVGRAVEKVWEMFVGRLRRELMEEFLVRRYEGRLEVFATSVLIGGELGRLEAGGVVWGGILEGVGYRGWDLFS